MSLDPKPEQFGDVKLQAFIGFCCGALAGVPVGIEIYILVTRLLPASSVRDEGLLLVLIILACALALGISAARAAMVYGPRFWDRFTDW